MFNHPKPKLMWPIFPHSLYPKRNSILHPAPQSHYVKCNSGRSKLCLNDALATCLRYPDREKCPGYLTKPKLDFWSLLHIPKPKFYRRFR